MGWSFGGHHTYWGITHTHRFKAASAGAGANDLISMYSQTDLPDFYQTYLGPRPWEDFKLYEARSAYRFVANVTTPLLIQVGEADRRVPAEQSIQFYEAMKGIGKTPVTLVLYPGQPHGIQDPRLSRDLMHERRLVYPVDSGHRRRVINQIQALTYHPRGNGNAANTQGYTQVDRSSWGARRRHAYGSHRVARRAGTVASTAQCRRRLRDQSPVLR